MSKAKAKSDKKQVVTIRLDENTLRKAQILAARCSTSIEDLLALQIELLAGQEEGANERSYRPRFCSTKAFIWAAEFGPNEIKSASGSQYSLIGRHADTPAHTRLAIWSSSV